MSQHVPQERVHNRVGEQIGCVPVPKIWEDVVDGMHVIPQASRRKPVFLDWPRRPASQPHTGKVQCTVKMRHHRGDQACAVVTVGLNLKGLNNMPRSGDVTATWRRRGCGGRRGAAGAVHRQGC